MKGGVEIDQEKTKFAHFDEYCELCAWALALAHAKSGDAAMIAGYVGKSDELDEAMVRFAFAYADQTKSDYDALKATKSGRGYGGLRRSDVYMNTQEMVANTYVQSKIVNLKSKVLKSITSFAINVPDIDFLNQHVQEL